MPGGNIAGDPRPRKDPRETVNTVGRAAQDAGYTVTVKENNRAGILILSITNDPDGRKQYEANFGHKGTSSYWSWKLGWVHQEGEPHKVYSMNRFLEIFAQRKAAASTDVGRG